MKLQASALVCLAAAAGMLAAGRAGGHTPQRTGPDGSVIIAAPAHAHARARQDVVVDRFGRTVHGDRSGTRFVVTSGHRSFKHSGGHHRASRGHGYDTLGDALSGRSMSPARHHIRQSQGRIEARGRGLAHGNRGAVHGHRGKSGGRGRR